MDETMSSSNKTDYAAIEARWIAAVAAAGDPPALEAVRVEALGKKGEISQLMKGLGGLDPDSRREAGQQLNKIKDAVQAALDARKNALDTAELEAKLATERVDVTLPPRPQPDGRLHPISQTIDEIVAIFGEMGFSVAEGPDIEDDFNNFTALNIPPDHPARQMQDTFYLAAANGSRHTNPAARGSEVESGAARVNSHNAGDGGVGGAAASAGALLLRTHTSPVQIRHMKSHQPPIRIIAPGRTYRSDSDMTHTPMFHQVEGLVIDETTHMGHLKGCLIDFCRTYFGIPDLPLRFRPSFFPFTEPSAEVDIGCSRKGGELKLGNFGDWLEILGCGMVHPKVLTMCGIDATKYQGFAFGMGIERIAMLKYGIPDLRTFYEADLRWLRHYGFAALDVPSLTGGIAR
jgi:phenylalanyl-tRNA synthetase alpha chain